MTTTCVRLRSRLRLVLAAAATLLLLPGAAQAQQQGTEETPSPFGIAPSSRPERPYRGIFGGGVGNTSQLLTFAGSLGAGLTSNPLGDQGLTSPAELTNVGTQANDASAEFDYTLTRKKMGVLMTNSTFVDYYPEVRDKYKMLPRDVFVGTIYFLPFKSTRMSVNQTFKDLPQFSYADLFGAGVAPTVAPGQDLRLVLDRYRRYGTEFDVNQRLSKRLQAFASVSYARGIVSHGQQWSIIVVDSSLNYTVSKGVALYIAYEDGGQKDEHVAVPVARDWHPRIDGGIDYRKALSFSRRTTVGFTTGTAGTKNQVYNTTTFHLTGGAQLKHEFGRTWMASVAYLRDVRYLEALNQPLFNDSVAVSVKGTLSRRLQLSTSAGDSIGHLGTSGATGLSTFKTYFASAVASYALNREVSLAADYSLYQYNVIDGTLLQAAGLIHRQTFHVNVQVWLPLITRTRVP